MELALTSSPLRSFITIMSENNLIFKRETILIAFRQFCFANIFGYSLRSELNLLNDRNYQNSADL